jgi:hypothetical protein
LTTAVGATICRRTRRAGRSSPPASSTSIVHPAVRHPPSCPLLSTGRTSILTRYTGSGAPACGWLPAEAPGPALTFPGRAWTNARSRGSTTATGAPGGTAPAATTGRSSASGCTRGTAGTGAGRAAAGRSGWTSALVSEARAWNGSRTAASAGGGTERDVRRGWVSGRQ